MPLFKSKSKKSAPEPEMPKAQSLAVAYGVRNATKKGSGAKMSADMPKDEAPCSVADSIRKKKKMAEGGEVMSDDSMEALKKENYADGGMVDLDNMESDDNSFDELNEDAVGESYDDDQLSAQPLESKGHEMEDELDRSVVSAIRRKMASKLGS